MGVGVCEIENATAQRECNGTDKSEESSDMNYNTREQMKARDRGAAHSTQTTLFCSSAAQALPSIHHVLFLVLYCLFLSFRHLLFVLRFESRIVSSQTPTPIEGCRALCMVTSNCVHVVRVILISMFLRLHREQ